MKSQHRQRPPTPGRAYDDIPQAVGPLPSTDVISHVLSYCYRELCGPKDATRTSVLHTVLQSVAPPFPLWWPSERALVELRSVSGLWSTAFGQYLELHVVPRGTELDSAGYATWTPASAAELLLLLLHLDDGVTLTLRTSFLYRLRIRSFPPLAVVRGLLPPRALPAVQRLQVAASVRLDFESPSTEQLAALLEWFPNVTSLDVEPADKIAAVRRTSCPLRLRSLRLEEAVRLTLDGILGLSETLEDLRAPAAVAEETIPDLARRFPALRSLEVRWCHQLTSGSALRPLTKLQSLVVEGPKGIVLTDFAEEVCAALPHLQCLTLHVALSSLPKSLTTMRGLTELSLREADLGFHLPLPEFSGALTALTNLDLSVNFLESLPESLKGLLALRTLNISYNFLESLPEWFGGLVALTTVELHNNKLTSLPASFGNLTALTSVNLSKNILKVLPRSILQLTALTTLNISNNLLDPLPDWLQGLPSLSTRGQ